MKKLISCLFCTFLLSLNIFATITKNDLLKFLSKSEGGIIIENDYNIFQGCTFYTKESGPRIFIADDNSYGYLYVHDVKYRISVSESYYDESLNILHIYRLI